MKQTQLFTLVNCILLFILPLTLCDFTNVRSMTHQVGPRTVAPASMDNFNHQSPDWVNELDDTVGMVGFSVRLVGQDNSTLYQQDLYLHHLIIYSVHDRNIACPEFGGYNYVAGSGAEFTVVSLRYPYANRIEPQEQLHFNYDVINPSSTDSIIYYIEYTFVIADWNDEIIEVEGYFNSITGCAGNDYLIYDVEQSAVQPYDNTFLDFENTFTGEFIYLAGHLHSGAKNIYLTDRDSGEIIFSATAHYDDTEHPSFLTSIDDSRTISYKPKMHDKHRIAAVYDSTERHEGVMAIVFGYVVVDDIYSGDPAIPQYFGRQNPFAGPSDGELVGGNTDSTVTPIPQPQNNNQDPETEDDDNLALLISMIVLAFVAAAVLLAIVVVGILAVVRYRARRYVVSE